MKNLLAPVCALAMGVAATCQTNRTMTLLAPAVAGQTAIFGMTHPVAAQGNLYAFLWSAPPFAGTTSITVPGLIVHGVALVDPNNVLAAYSGSLGSSGTVSHSLAVPAGPSFLGYAWDLQSVDLAVASNDLYFADNELQLYISSSNIRPNMCPIAAGTFQMGSNAGPPDDAYPYFSRSSERPVHLVTISRPFWMGKYEVTQAEYQALMNTNPSYFQGPSYPNSANRPVERESWQDAMAYCAALTAQEAAAGRLPAGYQYRLPTEAEWEYCCRAGTTTEFHYGNGIACSQANFWYSYHPDNPCNNGSQTAVVGGYAPNALGLFDMHGNVGEWCLDSWDWSNNYPSSHVVDPYVTNLGPRRVFRGGTFSSHSYYLRSAYRYNVDPIGWINLGFRVVLAPALF